MHRAKGDRLVRASVLPVCDNAHSHLLTGAFLLHNVISTKICIIIMLALMKKSTISKIPRADPVFLERGFICTKVWGSFNLFHLFLLNIP